MPHSSLHSLLASKTKSAVETKVYLIDFAQDDKSKYEGLKALLCTLDVGILGMCGIVLSISLLTQRS
jgi:hypothetical protein